MSLIRDRAFPVRARKRLGLSRPAAGAIEALERRALLASVSGTVYEDADANGTYNPSGGDFVLGGVTVYHDANDNGVYDGGGTATRSAPAMNLPRAIPDGGVRESQFTVSDVPGTIADLDVNLTIEHPNTFDIEATLISPAGTQINLFADVGEGDIFGQSADFTGTVLDDEAAESIAQGTPPFTGRYWPQQLLSAVDGEPANGTWTLRLRDDAFNFDEGRLIDWGLTFRLGGGEPATTSGGDGFYTLDLPAGPYRVRQVLDAGFRQTQPAHGTAYVGTLAEGQQVTGRDFGSAFGAPPAASVVGRHVFYNRSAYDGRDGAADARDDDAIAPDKRALEPGQTATFDNYTSYTRGINGIMVDISNLPAGAGLSASDFTFTVGNSADVGAWQPLNVSPQVTVRRGAGANGSDRVTLTWPDNTIVRTWLRVSVNPTASTGLSAPNVFYFGNLPGEVGDGLGGARVSAVDVLRVRRDIGARGAVTDIDHPFDFNRDRRIDAIDYAFARMNFGRSLHTLSPTAGPAAVEAQPLAAFSDTRIAARRTAYRPVRVWDEATAPLLA